MCYNEELAEQDGCDVPTQKRQITILRECGWVSSGVGWCAGRQVGNRTGLGVGECDPWRDLRWAIWGILNSDWFRIYRIGSECVGIVYIRGRAMGQPHRLSCHVFGLSCPPKLSCRPGHPQPCSPRAYHYQALPPRHTYVFFFSALPLSLTYPAPEYLVDAVAETVDFAMGRPSSSSTRSRRPEHAKFTTFVKNVVERAEVTIQTILATLVYIDRAKPHLHIALEEWALERVFLGAIIVASKVSTSAPPLLSASIAHSPLLVLEWFHSQECALGALYWRFRQTWRWSHRTWIPRCPRLWAWHYRSRHPQPPSGSAKRCLPIYSSLPLPPSTIHPLPHSGHPSIIALFICSGSRTFTLKRRILFGFCLTSHTEHSCFFAYLLAWSCKAPPTNQIVMLQEVLLFYINASPIFRHSSASNCSPETGALTHVRAAKVIAMTVAQNILPPFFTNTHSFSFLVITPSMQ